MGGLCARPSGKVVGPRFGDSGFGRAVFCPTTSCGALNDLNHLPDYCQFSSLKMEICRAWSHMTALQALGKVGRSIARSRPA